MNEARDPPAAPDRLDELLAWAASPDATAALDAAIADRERQLALLQAVRRALAAPAPPAAALTPPHGTPPPRLRAKPGHKAASPETMDRIRREIAALIRTHGPMGPEKMKRHVTANNAYFYEALKHPWFEKELDGYHLTQEGYSALRGEDTPAERGSRSAGKYEEE